MTTETYIVQNLAGGTELVTDDLGAAVLHALRDCPAGYGYILDAAGQAVDLSAWEVIEGDDGSDCVARIER